MNWLEANLQAMARFHPRAADRIARASGEPALGVWQPSSKGLPVVQREGVSWASRFDPVKEAERAVPAWEEVDLVVLTGIDVGYLAEAVISRYPKLPIVVAESDPRWFAELLSHRDLSHLWLHRYLVPVVGPGTEELSEALRSVACRRVELLHSRPRAEAQPAWVQAVARQVTLSQAQGRVNLATYRRFGTLWSRNLAANERWAREVRPLSDLSGLAMDSTAVVAAAGPSLADQFAWMKRHRDSFLLIAVDTAWSALWAQGLEPDLLLVLDGQYWNARHLDRPLPARTLVVTEWSAPPRAFRIAPGRTYVAASSLAFLRRREQAVWGTLGALPSGGSVATAAWSLALLLGCREVAFAGLDLGYPRGQTHVPGSQFEEATHRRAGRLSPAETLGLNLRGVDGLLVRPSLDGGTLLSDSRMDLFRDWLSRARATRPDVKAVNLSARGSVVEGFAAPPSDYGEGWLPQVRLGVPATSPLVPQKTSLPVPPFDALEAAVSEAADEGALQRALSAGEAFWGAEVWEQWVGRARRTWERWPSDTSRQAVVEALEIVVDWKRFWATR